MRALLVLFFSLFTFSCFVGQDPLDYVLDKSGIISDHDYVIDYLEKKHPGFKNAYAKTFDDAKTFSNKSGQLYTINVVVHVVWNDPSENLDDSIIFNQFEILNEDFQRLNSDTSNLRAIFQPVAGNPNIEFNVYDIIRVQTNETFGISLSGLPDHVKQTSQGGSDAFYPEYFLNIWICKLDNLFGALFGYAYPPAGLANWPPNSNAPSPELDGVVLDYRTVGNNNPNVYPNPNGGVFDLVGRTAVHEVGHYLGLRHIWGDGGGIFGGSSCGADDGCLDTPNQGYQSNFDCDTTLNTCIDSIGNNVDPNDLPDLIENHMDYSSESCSNMFTMEQSVIMRGVLENERMDLINPPLSLDQHNITSIHVFPNPAKHIVNIEIPKTNQLNQLKIVDVSGRLIFQQFFEEEAITVDLGNFKKGIYVVNVNSNYNSRLVVQ